MLARRYNKGKLRLDLIPNFPIEAVAEVYTRGAHKYSIYEDERGNRIKGSEIPLEEAYKYRIVEDGADNWRRGLSWRETLGSIYRHLSAYERGEDFDEELMTYHLANAGWNIFTLLEQYKTHPHLDDRVNLIKSRKIGLDIDGVLGDFIGHLMRVSGNEGHVPVHWNDPIVSREFDKIKKDIDFWAGIPPLLKPTDIPFEPHCYITARSFDPAVTQEWLDRHLFPKATLYCVGYGESKVEVAKDSGIDVFVDDSYSNFCELTKGGVFTYLYDAPYNRHYNVGHRRIKTLKEI